MEFGHLSTTCNMSDWYQRKWYECANQTDGFIFQLSESTAGERVSYTPRFTYHGFRYMELSAVLISANGTQTALPPALAAQFPFNATVEAHRAHSDLPLVGTVQVKHAVVKFLML